MGLFGQFPGKGMSKLPYKDIKAVNEWRRPEVASSANDSLPSLVDKVERYLNHSRYSTDVADLGRIGFFSKVKTVKNPYYVSHPEFKQRFPSETYDYNEAYTSEKLYKKGVSGLKVGMVILALVAAIFMAITLPNLIN